MKTKPGARSIRFAPDGRYGFVLNTKESLVNIFDAASNRMLHEVNVGKSPDQIMFSDTFAFVRSLETETVVHAAARERSAKKLTSLTSRADRVLLEKVRRRSALIRSFWRPKEMRLSWRIRLIRSFITTAREWRRQWVTFRTIDVSHSQ